MKKAFTLIELLIVVAIIAILAAIAVPNFLEAQIRAKVSRAKSDMRSAATGIESYYVDNNMYPICNTFATSLNAVVDGGQDHLVLEGLTTPIAYLTSVFDDSFKAKFFTGGVYSGTGSQPGLGATYSPENDNPIYHKYFYFSTTQAARASTFPWTDKAIAWGMQSVGPDLIEINMGGVLFNNSAPITPAQQAYVQNLLYDPTNGTVSFGELYRVGGQTNGGYASGFYQGVQGH